MSQASGMDWEVKKAETLARLSRALPARARWSAFGRLWLRGRGRSWLPVRRWRRGQWGQLGGMSPELLFLFRLHEDRLVGGQPQEPIDSRKTLVGLTTASIHTSAGASGTPPQHLLGQGTRDSLPALFSNRQVGPRLLSAELTHEEQSGPHLEALDSPSLQASAASGDLSSATPPSVSLTPNDGGIGSSTASFRLASTRQAMALRQHHHRLLSASINLPKRSPAVVSSSPLLIAAAGTIEMAVLSATAEDLEREGEGAGPKAATSKKQATRHPDSVAPRLALEPNASAIGIARGMAQLASTEQATQIPRSARDIRLKAPGPMLQRRQMSRSYSLSLWRSGDKLPSHGQTRTQAVKHATDMHQLIATDVRRHDITQGGDPVLDKSAVRTAGAEPPSWPKAGLPVTAGSEKRDENMPYPVETSSHHFERRSETSLLLGSKQRWGENEANWSRRAAPRHLRPRIPPVESVQTIPPQVELSDTSEVLPIPNDLSDLRGIHSTHLAQVALGNPASRIVAAMRKHGFPISGKASPSPKSALTGADSTSAVKPEGGGKFKVRWLRELSQGDIARNGVLISLSGPSVGLETPMSMVSQGSWRIDAHAPEAKRLSPPSAPRGIPSELRLPVYLDNSGLLPDTDSRTHESNQSRLTPPSSGNGLPAAPLRLAPDHNRQQAATNFSPSTANRAGLVFESSLVDQALMTGATLYVVRTGIYQHRRITTLLQRARRIQGSKQASHPSEWTSAQITNGDISLELFTPEPVVHVGMLPSSQTTSAPERQPMHNEAFPHAVRNEAFTLEGRSVIRRSPGSMPVQPRIPTRVQTATRTSKSRRLLSSTVTTPHLNASPPLQYLPAPPSEVKPPPTPPRFPPISETDHTWEKFIAGVAARQGREAALAVQKAIMQGEQDVWSAPDVQASYPTGSVQPHPPSPPPAPTPVLSQRELLVAVRTLVERTAEGKALFRDVLREVADIRRREAMRKIGS